MGSLASAGAALGPRARASANDTVRVACVGVHAQGREHIHRFRLGRTVHFDAASYSIPGDTAANKMFRREYRKPFVVPEKV